MKIFAHRGAWREAPENSLVSFQKAVEIGADGIEFDCILTRDHVPIVTHFDDLSLLFNTKNFAHKMDWNEIKSLGIPTLAQVLEIIRPSGAEAIFDIKMQPGFAQAAPHIIASLAQEMLPPQRILLTSFHWRHLFTLKRNFPRLQRGLILSKRAFALVPIEIFDKFLGIQTIHPLLTWTNHELVRKWHQKGLKVNGWVANTFEELKECEAMELDGVFTDDPRFAKTVVGRPLE